ncbi:MAG: GrrA/OscA1 family cyclophane-containing rSAM-modified RiPP [Prochlorococcus sp.]
MIGLYALLASTAVMSNSADAALFSTPDLANPLESRIQSVRNGPWSNLLQDLPLSPEQSDLQAAGKWKNGSNKGWKNSGGGSKWKNGSGSSWNKSGRVAPVRNNWGNGGWRNNYYGGSFVNW